jgi:beta-lactamase class A
MRHAAVRIIPARGIANRIRSLMPWNLIHLRPVLLIGALAIALGAVATGCSTLEKRSNLMLFTLDFVSPTDALLQSQLESIDAALRERFAIKPQETAIGLVDLRQPRLAMIRPDAMEYAASLSKIGILLAYFQLHPEAATNLDPQIRHELGLMAKASSNEMATRFSRQLTLGAIQAVLNRYQFYDTNHGGGLWMGKHYGQDNERIGDPLGNNSHAATVRQLLRFYLLLEQGRLVSPAASKVMRDIFASPDIPHDQIKFVKGLAGRPVTLLRKWGSWEDWLHDSAVIRGPNRFYILVALTHHPRGDDYLVSLAQAVDDLMQKNAR